MTDPEEIEAGVNVLYGASVDEVALSNNADVAFGPAKVAVVLKKAGSLLALRPPSAARSGTLILP